MDRVRRQLGLRDDWTKAGMRPVTIAVLDSGISKHPDLKEAILAFRDFTGGGAQGIRRSTFDPYDEFGHGTHVCGILCGSGAMSDGRFRGICPGALLVVGKVLDRKGEGSAEQMLEAMEWILKVRKQYDVRLLNVSVGISGLKDREKKRRLQNMMEKLSREGILPVCAAGNKGPMPGTASFLGEGERTICVGCHDGAYFRGNPNRCEGYSGRGSLSDVPRKPDLVAPGTRIWSCAKSRVTGAERYGYEAKSGTSMATPIVTGCLARVLGSWPELDAKRLKRLALTTANDLGEPWNKQGFGMIDPNAMMENAKNFT